jgi:hypothetical protein
MDIDNLIASSISRQGDRYDVNLPNFSGFVEWVFYIHDGVRRDLATGRFSDILSFDQVDRRVRSIFLMSQIFGYIFLRIIDSATQESILIIWERGKCFSFEIRGRVFFALLYRDMDSLFQVYTDFASDQIFRISTENDLFMIYNSLTETIVYQAHLDGLDHERSEVSIDTKKEEKILYYLSDILFGSKEEKLLWSFFSKIDTTRIEKIKEGFSQIYIDVSHGMRDYENIVWILGMENIILEEWSESTSKYLTKKNASDGVMKLDGKFKISIDITLLYPKWHDMRRAFLEMRYIVISLENHILLMEWSLDTIDTLGSPYLAAQEIRSSYTLETMRSTKEYFDAQLDQLTNALKYTITT